MNRRSNASCVSSRARYSRASCAAPSGIVHCASKPSSLRAREKSTRYERGSLPVSPVINSSDPGTASTTAAAISATVRLLRSVPTL